MRVMPAEFDYVVVGAGSAGCVVASRLSADPRVTVALVEAGGEDRHPWIHIPAALLRVREHAGLTWRTPAEPAGGIPPSTYVRGRVLGGTGAINGLLHVRGLSSDFDHWAQLGNHGWSAADVMPLFRRSESWLGPADPARGHDGPQPVSPLRERPPLCEAFRLAGERLGLRFAEDLNLVDGEGTGYYQQTRRDRFRASAARGHLAQARGRANLAQILHAQAEALTFDGPRATGITLRRGDARRSITARREVILCCGAIGSPHLLMLSGLGPAEQLRAHGIAVRQDLPGIGSSFQDHFVARISWRVPPHLSINRRTHGLRLLAELWRYARSGDGVLSLSAALFGAFVRSRPELAAPDLQFVVVPGSFVRGRTGRTLDRAPGMTVGCWVLRPEGRGDLRLRSADPREEPLLRPNPLGTDSDRATMLAGLRFARRWCATPPVTECCGEELSPGVAVQSDAALLAHARATGSTVGHYAGTCRMGIDAGAVVDPALRVRGVERLRVADASIMPVIVSGNTNATTLMIGEKAADLIRADR